MRTEHGGGLSPKRSLRDALAPYLAAARRADGSSRRPSAPRASGGRTREDSRAMRTWLNDNGYEVKDRGRIPSELVEAYETKTQAPKQ